MTTSRRALLVGIDYYGAFPNLGGCVNDVTALKPLLARNEDDTPNLECRTLTAVDDRSALTRDQLLESIDQLLAPGAELAVLYFAGHGAQSNGDVYLATSDGTTQTPGVQFAEILARVGQSSVAEVTVILDCCFSGGAGVVGALNAVQANLRPGLSILTASRDDQPSAETPDGRGLFSTYVEGALDGGAADVLGHVNVSNLYAYLSESFGAWEQRPTFKANIDRLHDVRLCEPRVGTTRLRQLTALFSTPDRDFALDPSFEPTEKPDHPQNQAVFATLQNYRACRLVDPIDEDHMYYAAMHRTGCRLTPLGKHYWHLVQADRI